MLQQYLLVTGLLLASLATSAEEASDCRQIWVWANDKDHSEIIMRVDDLDPGFLNFISSRQFPRWATYLGFGFFSVEYKRDDVSRARTLVGTNGGVWVSFYRGGPELFVDNGDYAPISIDTRILRRLQKRIYNDITRGEDGHPIPISGMSPIRNHVELTLSLESEKNYNFSRTCNAWSLDVLHEAGLKRVPMMVFSSRSMLRKLEKSFPAALQHCGQ